MTQMTTKEIAQTMIDGLELAAQGDSMGIYDQDNAPYIISSVLIAVYKGPPEQAMSFMQNIMKDAAEILKSYESITQAGRMYQAIQYMLLQIMVYDLHNYYTQMANINTLLGINNARNSDEPFPITGEEYQEDPNWGDVFANLDFSMNGKKDSH